MAGMSTRALGLLLLAAAVTTFCLGPFVWQVLTSLRPESELLSTSLPTSLSLDSYAGVFRGRPFARVVLNSLAVAAVTALLCVALGAAAAFALARLRFP